MKDYPEKLNIAFFEISTQTNGFSHDLCWGNVVIIEIGFNGESSFYYFSVILEVRLLTNTSPKPYKNMESLVHWVQSYFVLFLFFEERK